MINGQTVELKLLSESEVIELFGAREQVTRVAEVLTEGDGEESASFKARLKLPWTSRPLKDEWDQILSVYGEIGNIFAIPSRRSNASA